ncbi:uncharacterized protein LOC143625557 [Bidens hawaiensis]|uniref:uncharacterized protein LOC143625557 n=1 Tax=Bidens hawaiensis TaxID=980011 RepID=UPI00404AE133
MAPFEALYGRKCHSLICWNEVGESKVTGPEYLHGKEWLDLGSKERYLLILLVLLKILDRVGLVAYKLKLPVELSNVHPVFHVSSLKKCLAEGNFQIPLDEVCIDETIHFVERPIEIMDHKDKVTKRIRIPLVKVSWESKKGADFTWEREDLMKEKYPHLFATVNL